MCVIQPLLFSQLPLLIYIIYIYDVITLKNPRIHQIIPNYRNPPKQVKQSSVHRFRTWRIHQIKPNQQKKQTLTLFIQQPTTFSKIISHAFNQRTACFCFFAGWDSEDWLQMCRMLCNASHGAHQPTVPQLAWGSRIAAEESNVSPFGRIGNYFTVKTREYQEIYKPGPSNLGAKWFRLTGVNFHHPLGFKEGTPWKVLECKYIYISYMIIHDPCMWIMYSYQQ